MKGIVNFMAIRSIIANSMTNLEFGKAFGLAKKFFNDDDISVSICCGDIKIKDDGSLDHSIDKEIKEIYIKILSDYEGVFLDGSGCFYKIEAVDNSSFLSDESKDLIRSWGDVIIVSSSIDAEKKRIINDQTDKLYSHEAFRIFNNEIIFFSRFEKPIDKRFTPFFSNINSLLQFYHEKDKKI